MDTPESLKGSIIQIAGSVVDIRFESDRMPRIKEALTVTLEGKVRMMEVAQHIGAHTVRCIMMSETEGLSCGMKVIYCFFIQYVHCKSPFQFEYVIVLSRC